MGNILFKPKNFPHYEEVVPKHLRKKWEGMLTLSLKEKAKGYFIVPFACREKNVEMRPRTDKVKRYNKQVHTFDREYLTGKYRKYNTHDNAADEGYWGMFFYKDVLPRNYLDSPSLRYKARVKWLTRNMAYTFFYEEMGVTKEDEPQHEYIEGVEDSGELWIHIQVFNNYFLYEAQVPIGNGKYRSLKFGWKSHRSAPELPDGTVNVMYANRFMFSIKEYE